MEDNNQNEDSAMWFKAKHEHTQEAYEKYLVSFPTGIFKESAMMALEQVLTEAEDHTWEMALLEESYESFQNYLDKYPTGRYAEKAQDKLEELKGEGEELNYWEKATTQNTEESYRQYLDRFPRGKHQLEATQAIEKIHKLKEDEHWEKASKKDSIEAYELFLQTFENGFYSEQAQKALTARQEIFQLEKQFELAPLEEKVFIVQKTEELMQTYPEDFAVYDFHQAMKKKLKVAQQQDNAPTQVEEEQTIKPTTKKSKSPWVLIGILGIVLLILLALVLLM